VVISDIMLYYKISNADMIEILVFTIEMLSKRCMS